MSAAPKTGSTGRRNAVLRAFPDRAQRLHFSLSGKGPDAIAVWREAAHWLLEGRSLAPESPGYLLGCLLLLDGVVTAFDLRATWAALPDTRRDGAGAASIEWHDADGRLQRRHLSVVTQLSHALQRSSSTFDAAAAALEANLPDPAATSINPSDGRLHHLVEIVQAALVLMLSGDLAGHVIGRQPLTALSRTCLVRQFTALALLQVTKPATEESPFAEAEPDEAAPGIDAQDLGLHDAALADSDSGLLPAALVGGIRSACTQDPDALPNSSAQRASMERQLRFLAPACEAAGGWMAFLLLVVVTLVKVGTRETRPLAASSIWGYVPLGLDALVPRLAALPIAQAASIDWKTVVYEPALADPSVSPGQLGKLSAFLTAFHDVMCGVLGAQPMDKRLIASSAGPLECAELLWPHEVQRALAWLATAPPEDRLLAQAHAVLAMLAAGAFRFEDPFHLHLAGMRIDGETLQVAIDPLPTAGEGKTLAARRTVQITASDAVAVLLAWLERRHDEGGMPRDLLFGDPSDGRRPYRRGATMCVINALLKAATGEPKVGTHELRHAFLSLARAAMNVHDQRKLDSASAAAGHEWTATTLQRYCHLYEQPLRSQLDAPLRQLVVTERAACQLAGLNPGILRQRWKRARIPANDCIWAALAAAAKAVPLKRLDAGHPCGMPSNPLAPSAAPLRFQAVHTLLTDVVDGHDRHVVALRQGLADAVVTEALQHVSAWHALHGGQRPSGAQVLSASMPWAVAWTRCGQAKWVMVRRAMEKESPDVIVQVVNSWAATASAQFVDLTRVEAGFDLLKWLASTGLLADQLVLCHAQGVDPEPAAGVLRVLFSGEPTLRALAPRRGRPTVYLLVSSKAAEEPGDLANAALSVAGLHVLMFSAWVWVQMSGGQRDA
jgi:site-specific recombinase XerD